MSTLMFEDVIEAFGKVEAKHQKEDVVFPLVLRIRYPKYDGNDVEATGSLTGENFIPIHGAFLLFGAELNSVTGQTVTGEALRLLNPYLKASKGSQIDFGCTGFTLGIDAKPPFDPARVFLSGTLSSNPLLEIPAVESFSYLGTIECDRSPEKAIHFDSSLGRIRIANGYCFEEHPVRKKDLLTRVRVGQLSCETLSVDDQKPSELLSKAERILSEPLTILSFLARKPLSWFELGVTYLAPKGAKHARTRYMVRRQLRRIDDYAPDPLLFQGHLTDGRFDGLVRSFQQSELKEWLSRAIAYVVASYERSTIEGQITSAYLSIEALVAGFVESGRVSDTLSGIHAETLLGKIRETIHTFVAENKLEKSVEGKLVSKLRRIEKESLKQVLVQIISQTRIPTADLWPEGMPLNKGLQNLVDRRNSLIHRAEIGDTPLPLAKDLHRLRVILERAILALLGWDPRVVSPMAFQHSGWLTSPN